MQEEEPKDWGVLLWLVKVLAFPFSLFGSSLEMGAEPPTLCAGDSLATPALHKNEPKDVSKWHFAELTLRWFQLTISFQREPEPPKTLL